jgi:hypothetical protein
VQAYDVHVEKAKKKINNEKEKRGEIPINESGSVNHGNVVSPSRDHDDNKTITKEKMHLGLNLGHTTNEEVCQSHTRMR